MFRRLSRWGNILLNGNLFLFNPFFLDLCGFETRDLMDVVVDSEDEGVLLVVLKFAFLDLVLGHLGRNALDEGSTLGVVH